MNRRIERINDELKEQTALLIRQLKDPRLSCMITVVKVDTTADLKYCKVYVSLLATNSAQKEVQQKETLDALKSAAGFIKKELARAVNLRQTPELTFVLDTSLDHAMRIDAILKEVNGATTSN